MASSSLGLWHWECQGVPMAPPGQGLAARAYHTISDKSRAAGGYQGNPSPGHQAPPWVWRQAKASLGLGLVGGSCPGRAGLCGAGDLPCCSIAGAGTDGPKGLKWGPGQVGGGPRAWAGTVKAVGAFSDMTKKSHFY